MGATQRQGQVADNASTIGPRPLSAAFPIASVTYSVATAHLAWTTEHAAAAA